jgi:Rrf2 family protein
VRQISQKTKYALKALRFLADRGLEKSVLISELAQRQQIPQKFLEAILLELRNQGVLSSRKGKGGGYSLIKPPEQITLGAIIRTFDGPLALLPCASESAFVKCAECESELTCGTRTVFKEVRDAMAKILDSTTLADLIARDAKLKTQESTNVFYTI